MLLKTHNDDRKGIALSIHRFAKDFTNKMVRYHPPACYNTRSYPSERLGTTTKTPNGHNKRRRWPLALLGAAPAACVGDSLVLALSKISRSKA